MLNKGLKDKESIRIDNILKTLLSFVFIPEKQAEIEEALRGFGLNIESLNTIESNDLVVLLDRLHLDWNQKEQFADFLIDLSKANLVELSAKALAIYNHIQSESKTFSFGILTKIASAKANL